MYDAAKCGHSFAFVIHGGSLEVKSTLLACSLRQKLGPNTSIVAVLMEPESRWGAISTATRHLLKRLNVEVVRNSNAIDMNYPHGNKINAMSQIDGPAIFLDSDMLMMRPFITHHSFLDCEATLKAADINTFERGGGTWSHVYKSFDLPLPGRDLVATATQERMRPYYNAGFVRVQNGKTFSEMWLETARIIDADAKVVNKRPWLDQVALPVALARLNWRVTEASTALNFPAHIETVTDHVPYIAHYHFPKIAWENKRLRQDVAFYLRIHPELKDVLEIDPDWHVFLKNSDCTDGEDNTVDNSPERWKFFRRKRK